MSGTINFGIDLGTTNSLIARCENGVVEVFKNPIGHKESLPSVVGFRKERILVGDKAREYVEKDPANVFSCFKRRMGTSESFFVPNLGDFRTPIQLSAMVLSELRNFIYSGDVPQSVVITIPASFDTVQSNATKQAGYEAGYKEVLLLQEPVAASLAFANKEGGELRDGKWLVYDLGGGTFDVALVKISNGEMRVTDHEGNNYLGGLDFDNLIVDRLVVPYVEQKGAFADLANSLKSGSGSRNGLYFELLYKAEEAKKVLSAAVVADIEFEIEDDNGNEIEIVCPVTREAFEQLVYGPISETVDFAKTIIARNNLEHGALKEVVLVGGSTYIPLVRRMLAERLQVPVNASVDPTTAVAVGAAYFAATRTTGYQPVLADVPAGAPQPMAEPLQVKMAYQKNTNEKEEYFSAAIAGDVANRHYRLTRDDGGFDSGLKPLTPRIEEVLSLLPGTLNQFQLRFYDERQQLLPVSVPAINIVQGKYSLFGQPLPNDICIEVDDSVNNTTYLELLFEKNAILPVKKTVTKTVSRTIARGSDDQLLINILEGSRYATAQSNLPVGMISIKGRDLQHDLIKGSDVDLTIEITESRDIKVNAYVSMVDEEYNEVFNPTTRNINVARLREEVAYLLRMARRNLDAMVRAEDFETSIGLQDAIAEMERLEERLKHIKEDDVTDEKYMIEEQKRKTALLVDTAGKDSRLRELRESYYDWKSSTQHYLDKAGSEALRQKFAKIAREEKDFLTGSEAAIKRKIEDLRELTWDIRKRDLDYLAGLYMYYVMKGPEAYKEPALVQQLVERGDKALERKSAEELLSVINRLYDQLIDKHEDEQLKGTGLA